MAQKRVFMIHGWGGNPNSNWFPWLRSELTRQGYSALAPAMPNSQNPRLAEWIECMDKTIGSPTKSDYLVGHSLGVIAILRYLEQLKPGQEIGGAIFVAGFSSDLGIPEHSTFFSTPVNFNTVKLHCGSFVAFHSDNDPYVSLMQGEIFRERLGAELIVRHNMDHFSKGMIQFPDVLDSIIKMSKS